MDESELAALDARLQKLREEICEHPVISVTYFRPDDKKAGGVYLTKTGEVKKVDDLKKKLIFRAGTVVPVSEIIDIQGKIIRGKQDGE